MFSSSDRHAHALSTILQVFRNRRRFSLPSKRRKPAHWRPTHVLVFVRFTHRCATKSATLVMCAWFVLPIRPRTACRLLQDFRDRFWWDGSTPLNRLPCATDRTLLRVFVAWIGCLHFDAKVGIASRRSNKNSRQECVATIHILATFGTLHRRWMCRTLDLPGRYCSVHSEPFPRPTSITEQCTSSVLQLAFAHLRQRWFCCACIVHASFAEKKLPVRPGPVERKVNSCRVYVSHAPANWNTTDVPACGASTIVRVARFKRLDVPEHFRSLPSVGML